MLCAKLERPRRACSEVIVGNDGPQALMTVLVSVMPFQITISSPNPRLKSQGIFMRPSKQSVNCLVATVRQKRIYDKFENKELKILTSHDECSKNK